MSGPSNWLAKQKKVDLAVLADSLGLEREGLKKTELETSLEEHLSANSSKYSNDPRFATFYNKRRSESSPVKKEASSTMTDVAKVAKRRVTKASEELLATDDSEAEPATTRARSALTRTPRASALSNLSFASNVPLPPSPKVVADAIDRRTAVIRAKAVDLYEESGVIELTQSTRETLSSVVSVEALIIAFELYKIRPEILADRYAFTIPAIALLKTDAYPVKIPDLFLLLTASFWGPALLWAFTAFIVPLTAAYFVNLTSKPKSRSSHASHFSYEFDPLTFNIVKALLVFVVFGQDVTFGGLVDLESVARINSALYGGWQGVLVGTGIGTLVTLYDAIKK